MFTFSVAVNSELIHVNRNFTHTVLWKNKCNCHVLGLLKCAHQNTKNLPIYVLFLPPPGLLEEFNESSQWTSMISKITTKTSPNTHAYVSIISFVYIVTVINMKCLATRLMAIRNAERIIKITAYYEVLSKDKNVSACYKKGLWN